MNTTCQIIWKSPDRELPKPGTEVLMVCANADKSLFVTASFFRRWPPGEFGSMSCCDDTIYKPLYWAEMPGPPPEGEQDKE